jgi:hypothetical protein
VCANRISKGLVSRPGAAKLPLSRAGHVKGGDYGFLRKLWCFTA